MLPTVSPDGKWWWDGQTWQPIATYPSPAPPPLAPNQPQANPRPGYIGQTAAPQLSPHQQPQPPLQQSNNQPLVPQQSQFQQPQPPQPPQPPYPHQQPQPPLQQSNNQPLVPQQSQFQQPQTPQQQPLATGYSGQAYGTQQLPGPGVGQPQTPFAYPAYVPPAQGNKKMLVIVAAFLAVVVVAIVGFVVFGLRSSTNNTNAPVSPSGSNTSTGNNNANGQPGQLAATRGPGGCSVPAGGYQPLGGVTYVVCYQFTGDFNISGGGYDTVSGSNAKSCADATKGQTVNVILGNTSKVNAYIVPDPDSEPPNWNWDLPVGPYTGPETYGSTTLDLIVSNNSAGGNSYGNNTSNAQMTLTVKPDGSGTYTATNLTYLDSNNNYAGNLNVSMQWSCITNPRS